MSNRTVETTPRARDAFIEALGRGMTITAAAQLANLGRSTVYALRASDEAFSAMWDDALEAGTDRLEDEAFRRAHDGVEEPLVSGGKQVVDAEGRPIVLRRYSDNLLVTLLKARRPERFKDRLAADLRADVKVGPSPEDSAELFYRLLDGLAARKAAGLPTPELDALPVEG